MTADWRPPALVWEGKRWGSGGPRWLYKGVEEGDGMAPGLLQPRPRVGVSEGREGLCEGRALLVLQPVSQVCWAHSFPGTQAGGGPGQERAVFSLVQPRLRMTAPQPWLPWGPVCSGEREAKSLLPQPWPTPSLPAGLVSSCPGSPAPLHRAAAACAPITLQPLTWGQSSPSPSWRPLGSAPSSPASNPRQLRPVGPRPLLLPACCSQGAILGLLALDSRCGGCSLHPGLALGPTCSCCFSPQALLPGPSPS